MWPWTSWSSCLHLLSVRTTLPSSESSLSLWLSLNFSEPGISYELHCYSLLLFPSCSAVAMLTHTMFSALTSHHVFTSLVVMVIFFNLENTSFLSLSIYLASPSHVISRSNCIQQPWAGLRVTHCELPWTLILALFRASAKIYYNVLFNHGSPSL